jgi:hypothetical protein
MVDLGEIGAAPTAHMVFNSVAFSLKHTRQRLRGLSDFAVGPEDDQPLGRVLIILGAVIDLLDALAKRNDPNLETKWGGMREGAGARLGSSRLRSKPSADAVSTYWIEEE